jgi:hypothetical protein
MSTDQVTSRAERRPASRPFSQRPGEGPTEECLGSIKWYSAERGSVINTVICLTLATWETVFGRFGGHFQAWLQFFVATRTPRLCTCAGLSLTSESAAQAAATCRAQA